MSNKNQQKHYNCKNVTITFTPKETYRIINKGGSCVCDPSVKNDCYLANLAYCRHVKIMSNAPVSIDAKKLTGFPEKDNHET